MKTRLQQRIAVLRRRTLAPFRRDAKITDASRARLHRLARRWQMQPQHHHNEEIRSILRSFIELGYRVET